MTEINLLVAMGGLSAAFVYPWFDLLRGLDILDDKKKYPIGPISLNMYMSHKSGEPYYRDM